jgi:hypothetical protein
VARLSFYQRQPDKTSSPSVEAEIAIGDLTLKVHRFTQSSPFLGLSTRHDEFVSVKVEAFTDVMAIWRRLDKMRVFHKIEHANLRDSDDLARLLVGCGLRHVPFAGYQYEPDAGEGEKRRIKQLHARDTAAH